jgi:uracil-DNA glycosylase
MLEFAEPQQLQSQLTWEQLLSVEKSESYFNEILDFIALRRAQGTTIYPPNKKIFSAFKLTPFSEVKVVIVGQDPYHGPNQANGLSFSVSPGIPQPPSLQNIFKELKADLDIPSPDHGDLSHWAKQGALLLNSSLSVEENKPGSHAGIGWSRFTDQVLQSVNDHKKHVVFMLWGSFAQKKCAFLDQNKHLVLTAAHPSPLSAYRGFFGCKHFSKCNQFLEIHNLKQIDWQVAS